MNTSRDRGTRRPLLRLAAGALLLSGCAGSISDDDLRVVATGEGLYLLARSPAIARSMCVASGFDAARAEGRLFAEGRRIPVDDPFFGAGTQGCQMPLRSLVICEAGDDRCAAAGPTGLRDRSK